MQSALHRTNMNYRVPGAAIAAEPMAEGRYFDSSVGLLPRFVFVDEKIYEQELDRIFGACWLFVAPENRLAKAGDFITTTMGDISVIVWKGSDGVLRVFINECPHSMVRVTTADSGNAFALPCVCHGWSYQSDGHVSEAPERALYRVPRLEAYKGLLFASFDEGAAPLVHYLGDFTFYLDMLLDRREGGIEAVGADVLRWTVETNWKLPVEAYFGDCQREATLHAATLVSEGTSPIVTMEARGYQVSAGAGGVILLDEDSLSSSPAGDEERERSAEAEQRLGRVRAALTPLMGAVFPNLTFDWTTRTLQVWHPRGPLRSEVEAYCLVEHDSIDDVKEALRRRSQFQHGPAGMKSQDEALPWKSISTVPSRGIARNMLLNLQMGLGQERFHEDLPGQVSRLLSEMNQRLFYQRWQRLLDGENVSTGVPI